MDQITQSQKITKIDKKLWKIHWIGDPCHNYLQSLSHLSRILSKGNLIPPNLTLIESYSCMKAMTATQNKKLKIPPLVGSQAAKKARKVNL